MTLFQSNNSNARSGFTLLELLVAVAAFAIVLAAINSVYYAALRLRNKTTGAIDSALPLERTLGILKRDLSNLVLPGGTLSGTFQTGSRSNAVAGQIGPNFYTSGGYLDETTPFSEVERVSYQLVASTNRNGQDLIRVISRNLLASIEDQPEQQWLMTGVQAMEFRYFDGYQWRDSWDSTIADQMTGLSNSLPKAIKVQLQVTPEINGVGRALDSPVELIVPVMVQTRTNQVQSTTGGTE